MGYERNGSYTISARLVAYRSNAVYKELLAEGMKVKMSLDAEIKTALTCTVAYDPELDLYNDRLTPIQVVDGVEYPLGRFVIVDAEEVLEQGARYWQIEACDFALLLSQTSSVTPVRFAKGTKYLDAIQWLLVEAGIGHAMSEPCELTLPCDREDWEIGTKYLAIANELLAAINYQSLWFDQEGVARLEPIKAVLASNITQCYLPGEHSILCDKQSSRMNAYSAYNVFTAVYSSADREPMVATAVNESPLSPLSTVSRGRRICAPVEYVREIASKQTLQEYAEGMRERALLASEVTQFETAPIPTHGVGEIVALGGGIYREIEWALTLGAGGSYQHKARRAVL